MRFPRFVLLTALVAMPSVTCGATVSLDFTTAGDYTSYFRHDFINAMTTATQGGGAVSIASTRTGGGTVYSTYDANGAAAGTSTFSGITTASADFSVGDAGGSFGIYFYDNLNATTLVLINPDSTGTSDRVRVFVNGDGGAGTAGTELLNNVANNFTSISSSAFTNLSVKYYQSTLTPTVALLDIKVGAQEFTGITAGSFFSNYQVGVRSYDTTSANATRFDNFMIVPEPSAALLGGLGMLMLLRRRR